MCIVYSKRGNKNIRNLMSIKKKIWKVFVSKRYSFIMQKKKKEVIFKIDYESYNFLFTIRRIGLPTRDSVPDLIMMV